MLNKPQNYVVKKIIFICCIVLLVNACSINFKHGSIESDKQLTEQIIATFHTRINSGEYEEIYNNSDIEFQKLNNKEDMLTTFKDIHDELGYFKEVIDKRINVIINAPVQVRAVYISQYHNTVVTETFTFVERGEEIKLVQYISFKGSSKLPPLVP